MILDVKRIINTPGGRIDFHFEEDYSDVDFGGVCPATAPVLVVGEVRNIAGMLQLQMKISADLSAVCDRCLTEFQKPYEQNFTCMLASEVMDEKNDDIRLLVNDAVDLSEIAREVFILNMPTKILCRDDCKGLCFSCGVNLNFETCRCKKEVDPRLQALAKLLEE